MEEVIGSIPIRSTNHPSYQRLLASPNRLLKQLQAHDGYLTLLFEESSHRLKWVMVCNAEQSRLWIRAADPSLRSANWPKRLQSR